MAWNSDGMLFGGILLGGAYFGERQWLAYQTSLGGIRRSPYTPRKHDCHAMYNAAQIYQGRHAMETFISILGGIAEPSCHCIEYNAARMRLWCSMNIINWCSPGTGIGGMVK